MHGQYPGPKSYSEEDNFRSKWHALPPGCSLAGTDLGLFCSVFLSITRIGQQYELTNRAAVIMKKSGPVSLLQPSAEQVVSSSNEFSSCYSWVSRF